MNHTSYTKLNKMNCTHKQYTDSPRVIDVKQRVREGGKPKRKQSNNTSAMDNNKRKKLKAVNWMVVVGLSGCDGQIQLLISAV